MEDYAIKFEHVSKIYKLKKKNDGKSKSSVTQRFYALNDITFTIPKGEVVGILGTNGSGKSTLSLILAGISQIDEGTMDINGEQALIAINTGLDMQLTGLENINVKGALLGLSRKRIQEITEGVIEFAEIGDFLYQPVKKYSSGMKSRLGFSISLYLNPDIIIVDEALSVGDKGFAQKCLDKINELKDQGKTIVFISHSLPQVRGFCQKAMWIEGGRLKEYGDVEEVCDEYAEYVDFYNSLKKKEKKKRINKYELFVKLYNSGIKETKHLMAELQISKNTVYVYTRRAQKEKKIFKIDRNTEKNITKQLITQYPFEVALNLNLQPEIIYKYLENLGEKDQKILQRKILSQNAIWKKIKSLKVKYLKNNQEISVEESLKKIIPKLKKTEVFELIKFYYWCGKESMALQVINQIIYFAENSKEIKQQAQLEKDKLLREIMVKKIISRKGTTYSSLCKELNVRESFLIQILGREDEDR